MKRCGEWTTLCFGLLCGLMSVMRPSLAECIKVPFDRRRCYEYVTGNTDWETARRDCDSRGQRLAVIEDQDLLEFVHAAFPPGSARSTSVWVGVRRQAVGSPDLWVNGVALDKSAYPTNVPRVGRTVDATQFCTRMWSDGGLDDTFCYNSMPRFCETYKPQTFILRPEGFVLADIDGGQEVTSDSALTLMDCSRRCDDLWDCAAIRYHATRCWLHMTTTGGSFAVPSGGQVYERINVYTGAYDY